MDKKEYVETVLNKAVKAAYSNVERLDYRLYGDEEIVCIVRNDNSVTDMGAVMVCVTGDSLSGIFKDVSRKLFMRF